VDNFLVGKEEEREGSLCVISIPQSNWVEESRIEWKQDHSKNTRETQFIRYFFMEELFSMVS
jgi:hypothetical protein